MFDNFFSVAIVLLVNTCTKFCRKCNFGSDWSVLPQKIIWNGNIFPSSVTVKVNVMLRLSVLPARPTRLEFFGAIVVRPTVTYFDGVWPLLSTRDFGMLCFL